jgi:hypothetical protein
VEEDHYPLVMSEVELEWMETEYLEEHRVLESIMLAQLEEEEVHHVVDESFKYLHEDRLHTWLRAKNKGIMATMEAWSLA